MENELISFSTAKLAKEKGFDVETENQWWYALQEDGDVDLQDHDNYTRKEVFYAQTQSLLQRWLREKHGLHVLMNVGMHDGEKQTFYCNVFSFGVNLYKGHFRSETTVYTYEQALEEGLLEALKLIKL